MRATGNTLRHTHSLPDFKSDTPAATSNQPIAGSEAIENEITKPSLKAFQNDAHRGDALRRNLAQLTIKDGKISVASSSAGKEENPAVKEGEVQIPSSEEEQRQKWSKFKKRQDHLWDDAIKALTKERGASYPFKASEIRDTRDRLKREQIKEHAIRDLTEEYGIDSITESMIETETRRRISNFEKQVDWIEAIGRLKKQGGRFPFPITQIKDEIARFEAEKALPKAPDSLSHASYHGREKIYPATAQLQGPGINQRTPGPFIPSQSAASFQSLPTRGEPAFRGGRGGHQSFWRQARPYDPGRPQIYPSMAQGQIAGQPPLGPSMQPQFQQPAGMWRMVPPRTQPSGQNIGPQPFGHPTPPQGAHAQQVHPLMYQDQRGRRQAFGPAMAPGFIPPQPGGPYPNFQTSRTWPNYPDNNAPGR